MPGVSQQGLGRFVACVARAVRLEGEVTILVSGDRQMRVLNRRFRKRDRATDVLSFPTDGKGLAGDVAVSADIARYNAKRLGHTLPEELKILILHGMLHLAGYDHETDEGRMARREERLRRRFRLPSSLTGRTRRVRVKKR